MLALFVLRCTKKFSIEDLFSKCDQIRSFLRALFYWRNPQLKTSFFCALFVMKLKLSDRVQKYFSHMFVLFAFNANECDTWSLNSLFDIMNQALAALVVQLFAQVFKLLSNKSSDRNLSIVRVRKEMKSCKCPHITIALLLALCFEKNIKRNAPSNPVPQLFLKKEWIM